jgi:uncharacterized protein (DUF1778 family)
MERKKIMATTTEKTNERINLRLKPGAKHLIERAALFEGQTVSHFILTSALERAEKTVQTHETMMLTAEQSELFFESLAKPIRFNPKLAAALEDHRRRVTDK